jgi:pimeloyl-ACP methyl ester carboxylesterase
MAEMARDALALVDALGLKAIDLLGFSIGGMVAQEIVLTRPYVVRRLILAGTAPQGGEDLHAFAESTVREAALRDANTTENSLTLFFEQTPLSQAGGREFLQRICARKQDRDQATDLAARNAQLNALSTLGDPRPHPSKPAGRHHPVDAGGQRRQRCDAPDAE